MRSLSFLGCLFLLLPWINGAHYAVLAAPPVPPTSTALPEALPTSRISAPAYRSGQVDFDPYMATLQKRVRALWRAPQISSTRRTIATFSIKRSGEVFNLAIKASSGDARADEQALVAIRQAAPFEQLPAAYRESRIDIQFTFDINVYPSSMTALTRSYFPIKVWISPYFRPTGQLAPAETVAALRQGILDWTRLLLTAPTDNSGQNFILILQRLAEEKQEQRLLEAGVFVFVTEAEQADLKVEVVLHSRILDEVSGFFTPTEGHIGRIEIATDRESRDEEREFYLRTALMHAIGHALGLAHVDKQKCNLMSLLNHVCFDNEIQQCRADARNTRCVSVQLAQIRPIEKRLLESGKTTARETGMTNTIKGLPQAPFRPLTNPLVPPLKHQ